MGNIIGYDSEKHFNKIYKNIDSKLISDNLEYDKILEKTFEYICRNKLGVILDDENIFKIEEILEDFYENENFYRKKILDFKKKFLYNCENSLDITISNITKLIN